MSDAQMILDYAGPRKRSSFRLASRSLLECGVSGDAGVVAREWLAGQSLALASIVLTLLMLAVAAGGMLAQRDLWRRDPLLVSVFGLLVVAGLALIPVVIQQSWRRTVLRAWDGTLRLSMGGPLARRDFAWRYDEVDAVRLIVTQGETDEPVLAEIEILAARTPPIRLFTDHPAAELTRVHRELEGALRGIDPDEAAEAEAESQQTRDCLRGAVERARERRHRTFRGAAGGE